MKIYENGKNWVIEDYIDDSLVKEINLLVDKNIHNLLKLKDGYSTNGDSSEQYWLIHAQKMFYFKNEKFQKIKERYKEEVFNRLTKARFLSQEKSNFFDLGYRNCWAVVGEENTFHTAHCHNNGSFDGITTVLYLEVPKTNSERSPKNNIFLILNSDVQNNFYNTCPNHITVNPVIGKILIFPDWIIHGTYPQSVGIRKTFNFDFKLKRKTTGFNMIYC